MGYHVISYKKGKLSHKYAETEYELAGFDNINSDSIIFEGSGNIAPEVVSKSKKFKRYAYNWFRAGVKAEKLFKNQAIEHHMMVEHINQDKKSFNNYIGSRDEFIALKRGDFIIRDHGNIEVDVKCRSFSYYDNEKHFRFNVEHMFRHLNMAALLHSPVVVAVYERDGTGEYPLPDNICFMDIKKMYNLRKSFYKDIREYNGGEYFYNIPLSVTEKGFGYINQLAEDMKQGKYEYHKETIPMEEINKACLSKHYTNWTKRDIKKLKDLQKNGHTEEKIAGEMGRTTNAVKLKLKELEK